MKLSSSHQLDLKKSSLKKLTDDLIQQEDNLRKSEGPLGKERQVRLKRLSARERITHLLDSGSSFFELGIWAAYQMYPEWGDLPAAGVITGIGEISGRTCMLIVNDATVKAGAMFPQSVKKVIRAQRIAFECRLPIVYLVDSSGVFLPLQDDIFPDEDDFGRIFRNNAILSAEGIPQLAAIMGNCIAGGGYLPVLCDKLLMTHGSGLYLAGPALVKAAIGQDVDSEELGGAQMHFEISGTVDFLEADDISCLKRMRSLVESIPNNFLRIKPTFSTCRPSEDVYKLISSDGKKAYDIHDILDCIIDQDSLNEYKAGYGKTLVTAYARIQGVPIGIIANQRMATKTARGEIEIGGVIYSDAADKAARFIMDCNQIGLPLIFFQDVMGFMVGKEAEQSGIIRCGAKMVSAVSNSIVPKVTVIIGNSFGAGNYALCGKAYDPQFIVAWPNAKYAVMGAGQAADTLFTLQERAAERQGKAWDKEEAEKQRQKIRDRYEHQMDIRYGAARGWVDAIIPPHLTRECLTYQLEWIKRAPPSSRHFHTGVFQV